MVNLRQLVRDVVAELNDQDNKDKPRFPVRSTTNVVVMELEEARRFLKNLDPHSQEGLWFDAIADGYPTRVDAAVVYLREVKGDRSGR